MSVTTADPDDDDLKPVRLWVKVVVFAVVMAGVMFVFFYFSGHWGIHHENKAQKEAMRLDMPHSIPNLTRPAPTPATFVQTAPIDRHNPVTANTSAPPVDKERQLALNSSLDGYTIKSNATTTAAQKVTGGAADPPDSQNALEASLQPTKLEGTRVAELPDPHWLIEQGRILPCLQQTRINSTLPGGVTAVLSGDVYGETGNIRLLPDGSRIFGTLTTALVNGLSRVAVLWQNITTPVFYGSDNLPHQYRVTVNSPAASELGETGLDGDVNRHLLWKIGGILGASIVQGGIQAGVGYASRPNGNGNSTTTLNLNSFQTGSQEATNKLLSSWIDIPDIITRDQGLRCGVFLMRDLDMRGAYKLVARN